MTGFDQVPSLLTEQTLRRDGCDIHYWLGGPVGRLLLVFMHGATMDHHMFNAQVEAFGADYQVLAWDARGHGRSRPVGSGFSLELYAGDVLAILDEIGAAQAVLCGQSLGGYIAQHVYMLAPQRVRAMVIIGSTPLAKAYSRWEIWALKATMPLFKLWPYRHLTKVVAKNTAVTPAVREYALAAIRQISREDFLTIWQAVTLAVDEKGRPDLTIDVPLLLLHGEQDRTGTIRRDMPLWAAWEENAEYHVIPTAGHNANQDNAIVTNQLIETFLQKLVD
jgi:3-oxoadipate enol-lactonase